MFLTRISVLQPVFAAMVMVAIGVFGVNAYRSLPIDQYPNVDFPVVAILTSWIGASPESVESEITTVIEEAVNTLAGVDTITSTSQNGHSTVVLMFDLDSDSMIAAQEVRDRIAAVVEQLPSDAGAPTVVRFNPTATPILSLAISDPTRSLTDLTRLAEDIVVPALTAINGVGSANVVGAVEDEVEVLIDPERLRAFNLGVNDVVTALRNDNLILPAGSVIDGVLVQSVQLNTEVSNLEELRAMVVTRQGGAAIVLGDLAQVRWGVSEPDGRAFRNGVAALAIDVVKVDGGNTVAVAQAVLRAVERLQAGTQLDGARIDVLRNAATPIEASFRTVQATLIEGGLLATAIVFLFLNSWRSTVITGLTLPISILGTLAVIALLGFTLNTMTMLALILSIGIIIDDAIVVRENITRHLHMGKSHVEAALQGTAEIGFAVLATSLSIVAVFMPLAFMQGIVGKFFLEFGVTVSVAVLVSLFVSFTLDPMLSSIWYDPASQPNVKRGPIGRAVARFEHGFERLARVYRRVLVWCLSWRKTTLAGAFVVFVSSFGLVPLIGAEFLPPLDESRLQINVNAPVGSSADYTAIKAAQVTRILMTRPEVESVYTSIAAGSQAGDHQSVVVANLVAPSARELSANDLVPVVRAALAVIPGVEILVTAGGGVGPDQSPITIKVTGNNPVDLDLAAARILDLLVATPGTVDARLSTETAQPLMDFVLNREVATDLGVNPAAVGGALRVFIAGEEVSELRQRDGTSSTVVVRLPEELRNNARESLDFLPVAHNRSAGTAVTLGEVATLRQTLGPSRIERENLTRVITIISNFEGRILGDVVADITAGLATLELPPGVAIQFGGDAEMLAETSANMGAALLMAVVFIYLVIASQFGSLAQPLAIMAALPLSLIGVLLGLLAWGSSLNMFSMIGFVMLMGLVVKNAILLVDNANHHMQAGMPVREALEQAGVTRFRPIIMTTLAMIFGMMPLALAIHEGAEQNASMAHAVIGGLISSTLLTLVVVPVILTYVDALSRGVRRFLTRNRPADVH